MNSYDCRYAMYIHHHGVDSVIHGEDIIDAIKHHNQNAILVWCIDDEGNQYFVREHDEPDDNGYYNYYWVDENDEVVFDQMNPEYRKERADALLPIEMKNTTTNSGWLSPDGKFYECGFEDHTRHATELFNNKIVEKYNSAVDKNIEEWQQHNHEYVLEQRKWVKLSSGEILYRFRKIRDNAEVMSIKQKYAIIDYMNAKGKELINVLGTRYNTNQILNFK